MNYLFTTVFDYIMVCGMARFFMRGSEDEQAERAYHWRPVVGFACWLVTAPILFTGWL
jgi:hypothetical protein